MKKVLIGILLLAFLMCNAPGPVEIYAEGATTENSERGLYAQDDFIEDAHKVRLDLDSEYTTIQLVESGDWIIRDSDTLKWDSDRSKAEWFEIIVIDDNAYDEEEISLCVSSDSVSNGLVTGSIARYGIYRPGKTIWLYDNEPDKNLEEILEYYAKNNKLSMHEKGNRSETNTTNTVGGIVTEKETL